MIEARDMVISRGENNASDDDELELDSVSNTSEIHKGVAPRSNVVLHHEFVNCFGRVCHVNLSLSIPKVCLYRSESRHSSHYGDTDLLSDVSQRCSMVQVEATLVLLVIRSRSICSVLTVLLILHPPHSNPVRQ